ncbi:MAG: DoxX family membrane protein [candidate division Zixibacteria bacterium]|nr:DoxX family membrane protein [candidate division Zixibacteria bacterium]
MNKLLHDDYLSLITRLVVGGIFIYASLDKIANPSEFARIVYNYHLAPGDLVNLAAIILPWLELICGLSVILGFYKEGGILIISFLMVVFIVAIGINVIRGVDLECGCFTVSSKARGSALSLLYRDIGLLAICIYAWLNKSKRFFLSKN